jgi:hypothetical protein
MADAIRILSADFRGDEDRGEVRLERADSYGDEGRRRLRRSNREVMVSSQSRNGANTVTCTHVQLSMMLLPECTLPIGCESWWVGEVVHELLVSLFSNGRSHQNSQCRLSW